MANTITPAIQRVLPRLIVSPTGCHLWSGAKDGGGYGMVREGKRHRKVHRVVYEAAFGFLPSHLDVLHRCDVRNCCNPEHLFLGTDRDNQQDRIAKGRGLTSPADVNRYKTHCMHGHEFTDENTRWYLWNGKRHRACKACARSRPVRRDKEKQRLAEKRRTERRRIARAALRAERLKQQEMNLCL